MESGLELTPLRAYAHQVPHYYLQSFGPAVTHPDTNEYSGFVQDTIRVSDHLALSLGARYDLQTFTTAGLQANPLWPDAGKVPFNTNNVAPRVGLAYSLGNERPLVIRAGYGRVYTRIPQIYTSTIQSENGLAGNFLFLNNNYFYDRQIFPQYPNPLVNCPVNATDCEPPSSLTQLEQADVSAFSHDFKTPGSSRPASISSAKSRTAWLWAFPTCTFRRGPDPSAGRESAAAGQRHLPHLRCLGNKFSRHL